MAPKKATSHSGEFLPMIATGSPGAVRPVMKEAAASIPSRS
jgi:hypothetical protein